LAQSISSLPHLQSLKIILLRPHINPESLGYQISDLFSSLTSFKSLQALHIFMPHFGRHLENNALFTICDAIENLIELREFKLDTQRSQIDDKGVLKLSKTLPKLVNLENIKINLSLGVRKENDTLIALLRRLSVLKHLGRIDLGFSCSEMNLTTYSTMVLLLNRLRNLSYFKFELILANNNPEVKAKFEALLERQYQCKKEFKFYCQ